MHSIFLLFAAIIPVDGQVIQTDTVVTAGTYALPNGLTVAGNGIHVDLTGVTLQGGGVNAGLIVKAQNSTITGGTVTGYDVGLELQESANNVILGTHFTGNGHGGHTVGWSTKDNLYQQVAFSGNTHEGLLLDYSSQVQHFVSSSFDGNGEQGIFVNYNAPTFDGCSFSGNGANGFFTVGYWSRATVVKHSQMNGNVLCGAQGWTAPAVRYESNTASGNGRGGICIEGGPFGDESDGELVGNTIDHNAAAGIIGYPSNPHVLVQGNSVHDNQGPGIANANLYWNITGNEIDHNSGDGVQVIADSETLTKNRIHDNCGAGVNLLVATVNVLLENNDIYRNGACRGGVQLVSVAPFDAGANGTGNWWGHSPIAPGVDTSEPAVTDSRAHAYSVFDSTPPQTSLNVGGLPGDNGWYRSPITVSLTAVDAESGVASTVVSVDGLASQSYAGAIQLSDGIHHVIFFSTDNAGNVEGAHSVTLKVDSVAPTITFAGNTNQPYMVDQTIGITCSSGDLTSGLAASACPNAIGPAYSFGLGSRTLLATASDNAGNTSTATTTFVVQVTNGSLCMLNWQFIKASANYGSLPGSLKTQADAIVTTGCAYLDTAATCMSGSDRKREAIAAYQVSLKYEAQYEWLTTAQRDVLIGLSNSL